MRVIGLEPTRLAAPDPKSGMSTNFTIPAGIVAANIDLFFESQKLFQYSLVNCCLHSVS